MTTRPFAQAALLVSLLVLGAGAAPYKWVDKDGNVHYSDKPPPSGVKSEQVELKPLTEVTSQPVPQAAGSPPPEGTGRAPDGTAGGYNSFRITSPADQSTLRDLTAPLNIGVALDPALQGDDRIEYTFDGKVVTPPIEGLERGTHHIGARVVSANGGLKIAASEVTIYVHQSTVQQVTPTKPKPPPKKTP